MGMCAIYQEVKEEDFKKLLESDDFFETIEELEEKDGTELCDIDKMWDALHFLLNGLSAIHGIPEDNILSEFIIGSESALVAQKDIMILIYLIIGAVIGQLVNYSRLTPYEC